MEYDVGPFATDSPVYKFLVAQEIPIKQKIFERYGWYWSATLNEEQAAFYLLKFPKRRFFNPITEEPIV